MSKTHFQTPIILEEQNATEKESEDSRKNSLPSTVHDKPQSQKHSEAENRGESCSDGADVSKGRPMSPSTLALMCDENDTMFNAAAAPNRLEVQNDESSQSPLEHRATTEAYEEQERIILTKFRDCLNRLITLGEIKGKWFSFFILAPLVLS